MSVRAKMVVDTARLDRLFAELREELIRAMDLHKPMCSYHDGKAVIEEELDELWDEIKAWHPGENPGVNLRKEALQVAAMGLRFILDLCDDE